MQHSHTFFGSFQCIFQEGLTWKGSYKSKTWHMIIMMWFIINKWDFSTIPFMVEIPLWLEQIYKRELREEKKNFRDFLEKSLMKKSNFWWFIVSFLNISILSNTFYLLNMLFWWVLSQSAYIFINMFQSSPFIYDNLRALGFFFIELNWYLIKLLSNLFFANIWLGYDQPKLMLIYAII